ncbi:hypothetical protein Desmu_0153 [Desulfurococcus mucosus DSM 2162]|uniref:Uncharacterized protein n=2 Tax=Desulfurococcus mucosus TaxID=2275 RepID=E8R739_DESM0|nr:hypothetical protein Desmu_0153 [Desulfurococcus mucosus DSM 2162]
MISDLAEFLRRHGFKVIAYRDALRVPDEELPIYLEVKLDAGKIYTAIGFTEELREILEEKASGGESIEDIVEDALSRLNTCALLVKKWADERRLVTIFRLREGSVELMDLLEELREEMEG